MSVRSLVAIGLRATPDERELLRGWLTREARGAGDPSLRLKGGSTQDDSALRQLLFAEGGFGV